MKRERLSDKRRQEERKALAESRRRYDRACKHAEKVWREFREGDRA